MKRRRNQTQVEEKIKKDKKVTEENKNKISKEKEDTHTEQVKKKSSEGQERSKGGHLNTSKERERGEISI